MIVQKFNCIFTNDSGLFDDDSQGFDIIDNNGRVVCGTYSSEFLTDEEKKIAQLLSAAPDLLEALESIASQDVLYKDLERFQQWAQRKAKQAIKKATE